MSPIRLILLLFLLIGTSYALLTPPFEASDELWHYPMIQHLGNGQPLPVQVYDPALAGPWKQEASQPPLYYYLGALATFWVDTSDMAHVRWLNPHVDNGVITADGNTNLAIHPPEWSQWRGSLLAVRLVRLLSVLLGAGTVYLTYLIGLEVAPQRPWLALGAAVLNGFTPMFLFISGAVNNDNLAIPLASLGVLLLIRMVTQPPARPWLATLLIGAVIGAAVLTKQGTIGLLPLAWGTFFIYQWVVANQLVSQSASQPIRNPQSAIHNPQSQLLLAFLRSLAQFALMAMPVVLIAGWWYGRNIQLYGDLLGWSAFIAVLGERETAAPLAQLWQERWGFMLAYWGLFGGVNIPLWTWVYHLLNGLVVAAVLGFVLFLGQLLRTGEQGSRGAEEQRGHVPQSAFRIPHSAIEWLLNFVVRHFPLIVCLLFSAAVVYGLVQWATTTWSSQGRLVFTAISTLNVLWVLGLAGWLSEKWGKRVLTAVGGFLILLSALTPWLIIRPAYQPARAEGSGACTAAVCLSAEEATFGDHLRLLGYTIATPSPTQPGDEVEVWLEWQVLAETERDWSVFVHLNDPVLGVPIAQRDMYLGQGLLPTSLLREGEQLTNYYRLTVPRTAVSPAALALTVGLYDYHTGERLLLTTGGDHLPLTTIPLTSRAGDVPNPVSVNFNNQFELIGYELEPRRTAAGQPITATLYWRVMSQPTADYTFFAQIVGTDTTRWAAQDVGQPTSQWAVGEMVPLTFTLTLAENTPANIYPLRIGVYLFADGQFTNLQTVTPDGRLSDDFYLLTQMRVD